MFLREINNTFNKNSEHLMESSVLDTAYNQIGNSSWYFIIVSALLYTWGGHHFTSTRGANNNIGFGNILDSSRAKHNSTCRCMSFDPRIIIRVVIVVKAAVSLCIIVDIVIFLVIVFIFNNYSNNNIVNKHDNNDVIYVKIIRTHLKTIDTICDFRLRDNSVHLHECSRFWVGILITFNKDHV